MEIPYTTTPRADTGMTNPTLGIWLFLASEVMLFGSLFSSYALLRSGAAEWPDQSAILNVPLATLNTLVLVGSSITIWRARLALSAGDWRRYRRQMAITVTLGVCFLAAKGFEYVEDVREGLTPSASNFLGLYFTLTGLHALHVIGGIAVNGHLLGPGVRMWRSDPARYAGRLGVASVYWNFVDAVWLAMFAVLYLM